MLLSLDLASGWALVRHQVGYRAHFVKDRVYRGQARLAMKTELTDSWYQERTQGAG